MPAITASMVAELRAKTDAPMMECKKALVETGGDIEAAAELMRKQGLAKADKKAFRDFLASLAYPCTVETDNPVYRMFLR